MFNFVFGLFIFLATLFLVGLVGGLLYLIYLPFKKKLLKTGRLIKHRSKQINIIYIVLIVLFAAYVTLDAFFPSSGFYEGEFKAVTLRDIPESAEFIKKTASYPDFHGDYCSSSQIKLSKADYQRLLRELSLDNRMTKNGEIIGSEEFDKALGDKSSDKIIDSFTRQIAGEEDDYLYIGFYEDGQTIFVNVCVT